MCVQRWTASGRRIAIFPPTLPGDHVRGRDLGNMDLCARKLVVKNPDLAVSVLSLGFPLGEGLTV